MNQLRKQFLEAVKASSRKTLITKSATAPQVLPVRNRDGELLGFFPCEPVPYDDVERVVSKNAQLPDDPNACFDDARIFPISDQPVPREIQKGAQVEEDLNKDLIGIFPRFLR